MGAFLSTRSLRFRGAGSLLGRALFTLLPALLPSGLTPVLAGEGIGVIRGVVRDATTQATALQSLQRRIVLFGYELGAAAEAVGIARELAMTTYRTAEEFRQRFSLEPYRKGEAYRFEVEDYLAHHGAKFAGRFDPAHFLTLCLSLDLHRVEPEAVRVPTTVLAVKEDTLVPLWQMRELAERLGEFGELVEISSLKGHDAFLVETETVEEGVMACGGRPALIAPTTEAKQVRSTRHANGDLGQTLAPDTSTSRASHRPFSRWPSVDAATSETAPDTTDLRVPQVGARASAR